MDTLSGQPVSLVGKQITAKGLRTRAAILRAARDVFEEVGYVEARISDITEAAGVAYGTFYTYFHTKDEAFHQLADQVVDELCHASTSRYPDRDPALLIHAANRQFLRAYKANSAFMRVLEQAAALNNEHDVLRRRLRSRAVERVERSIRRYAQEGLTDPALDPHTTAHALVSMLYNFAYTWLSHGEPLEESAALNTLTRLWCNGLRLPVA